MAAALSDKIRGPRVQSALQLAEDSIHLVVATFLVLLAALLAFGVVSDVVSAIRGPYEEQAIVLTALDSSLVLFIVAELLHTVRLTIQNRRLNAEPFLVVGMIAGVRKVLIVTAESEQSFRWNVQGVELVILTGLILVMALALFIWRRALAEEARPGLALPDA
ncbi:phosphate-starvation-inducible PsiE family protein [Streptomyces sp. NPDC002054]|uniref:phosphate-starvation-inducible PsiE family protein n=1 Tax=Streptomyces sp. NPDC002054 TaxID=3154663 RepID=UPI0033287485